MTTSEAERLEALWAGRFGDEYVERNLGAYDERRGFWRSVMASVKPRTVLEVGCNVGGNLQWVAEKVPAPNITGIDVNQRALAQLRSRVPGVNGVWGSARDLPFEDQSFDLVFTMGVLIHQPDESLPEVMDEMVRVAKRYVLCGEYFDNETKEVHYRGHSNALFRRDYGGLFVSRFPGTLNLSFRGLLTQADGFDDVTWWLFERAGGAG
jgi:pseudaminic acid biosynthesis-associated methylase